MNATLTVNGTPLSQALRAVMGHFPTGVTIVGAHADGEDQGMTANSLTCVSLDPPLVAVCTAHGSRTGDAIESSGSFAITFLAHHQHEVARQFARVEDDHFAGVETARTPLGHPYLPEGIGFIECVVHDRVDAGDHSIFIGLVTETTLSGGQPLVFFRSRLGSIPHDSDGWT
jgi:flavin reductase (DIM6/NTAB) family NADH-FMN oxidoreductase RutF